MAQQVNVRAHRRRPPGGWFFKTVPVRAHTRSLPSRKPKWTWKRVLLWLLVIYLFVHAWDDPRGSSAEWGPFLGDVGRFLIRLVRTIAVFLDGLASA